MVEKISPRAGIELGPLYVKPPFPVTWRRWPFPIEYNVVVLLHVQM